MITMSTMADQAKVKANDLRGMAKSMQYASNQLQVATLQYTFQYVLSMLIMPFY